MVFGRFPKLFSRFPPTNASNPYNLPPIPGSNHNNYTYSTPKKATLRLSSSLQDLSTYHQIDPENLGPGPAQTLPQKLLAQENGASSFSKEKAPPISPARKNWLRVFYVLLCLLLLAFLCFGSLILYLNWFSGPSKYYVVLDCGSTGTRVYVYHASVNRNKEDRLPILVKSLPGSFQTKSEKGRAYNRMETDPGLDKLVHNVSGLNAVIKPLIEWAEKQIPRKSHKSTSLFLYATAGVRRLQGLDSEWILDNVWSILKGSRFLIKREWVKTITGMEEAYFGWIALNYHTGVLGSVPVKETYGALDLGGSSLQVTFENNVSGHDDTSLNLSIGPVNHNLSAYSLSGYGLNDAFDKSVARLLMGIHIVNNTDLLSGEFEIKHPCLQSGYKEKYVCSYCAISESENGTKGRRLNENGKKSGVHVNLVGDPKWDECGSLAKIAVNSSEWSDHKPGLDCERQPCALSEDLPRPIGRFYSMSGFYVVYKFFNLTSESSLDDVLRKGREFCEKDWDTARKSVPPQPSIEQYCFRAPYVVSLLRQGLHIKESNVVVGSGSITWSLGVALIEAGRDFPFGGRFYDYPILKFKTGPLVLFGILFASLFVLICVCSYVCNSWWLPKFFRRLYLPLFRHHNGSNPNSVLNIPSPFRFQRWSPVSTGDVRVKMPLSPTVTNTQQRPFDAGGVQFYSSSSVPAHSFSSGNLGQMQFENNTQGSSWTPHRGQRLQSRRSQSREDLSASLAEVQLSKV